MTYHLLSLSSISSNRSSSLQQTIFPSPQLTLPYSPFTLINHDLLEHYQSYRKVFFQVHRRSGIKMSIDILSLSHLFGRSLYKSSISLIEIPYCETEYFTLILVKSFTWELNNKSSIVKQEVHFLILGLIVIETV